MKKKIVVAVGGSSGSIYAKLLLDKLSTREDLIIGVVMTDNAKINWEIEIGPWNPSDYDVNYYENNDYYAPFASGSAQYECMIVCPCSMGLLSRINHGISNDLITRATDVILKERRKLIVVPREAPYNLIHLRNMTSLTEAGAIICPATPSFYSNPTTLDEIALTVVDRVIDLAGINQSDTYRWSES
ncbi:MAG: UbiX family flavin prenyltransferase [Saprospiraceae bacterium]|jgi:4-hydroxy-3-polyprenylbenzoate decarboxylase|tara:strand:- start:565 stop:1125 length:561 start_codon:yes stop_codon:yes gene_type:complete